MQRVAVTGTGVICALGHNTEEFWDSVSRGASGIRDVKRMDTSKLRFHRGAESLNNEMNGGGKSRNQSITFQVQ